MPRFLARFLRPQPVTPDPAPSVAAALLPAIERLHQAMAQQQAALAALSAAQQAQQQAGQAAQTGLQALADRLEFTRNELFFEMRALGRADFRAGLGDGADTPPAILSPERVAAQRSGGGLRLNVGCGHRPDPTRLNIDLRALPGVDVVAAADRLPFAAGEVREIFSSHVLEHFPHEALRRTLLPAWVALLAPGGELRAVVPDAEAMMAAHARSEMDFETLRLVTFGGQEYAGDFHHTMFTPDSLAALMAEAGLGNIRIEARGRRNGACLEFELVGVKP